VNELTIPNSAVNNDIQVNVFVSMCDDFEVANPTSSAIDNYSWFPKPTPPLNFQEVLEPQSGDMAMDKDDTPNPSTPVAEDTDVHLGAMISDTDRLADICYGEKITSLGKCASVTIFTPFIVPASPQISKVGGVANRETFRITVDTSDFPASIPRTECLTTDAG
jgi:hypothetical protein